MKKQIELIVPKWSRKGQAVFNFLEWLTTKGYQCSQSPRMADPFHIQDEDFDKLWEEFIKTYI